MNAHNRVRSLGNLADLSQLDQDAFHGNHVGNGGDSVPGSGSYPTNEAPGTPLHRSHTISERPQSIYNTNAQMNGPTSSRVSASVPSDWAYLSPNYTHSSYRPARHGTCHFVEVYDQI